MREIRRAVDLSVSYFGNQMTQIQQPALTAFAIAMIGLVILILIYGDFA